MSAGRRRDETRQTGEIVIFCTGREMCYVFNGEWRRQSPPFHQAPPTVHSAGSSNAMLDRIFFCVIVLVLFVATAIVLVPHFQDWLLRRI